MSTLICGFAGPTSETHGLQVQFGKLPIDKKKYNLGNNTQRRSYLLKQQHHDAEVKLSHTMIYARRNSKLSRIKWPGLGYAKG